MKILKSNNRPLYANVKDFGAKGNGTNDDTVAFQTAINYLTDNNIGRLYVPNGVYIIGGSLQTLIDGVNPNCQIYFKSSPSSQGECKKISIIGESNSITRSGYTDTAYAIPRNGVIIKSTITGSGLNPSVFGGKGINATYRNQIFTSIEFENISIQTYTNNGAVSPTVSCVNGLYFFDLQAKNCSFGIDVMVGASHNPNDVESFAILNGPISNTGPSIFEKCLVYGYKYGMICSEHNILNAIYAFGCVYPFVIPDLNYNIIGNNILVHGCNYSFLFPNADLLGIDWINDVSYFRRNILCTVEIEHISGQIGWNNSIADIVDPGNKASGIINYRKGTGSTGEIRSMTIFSGGSNLILNDINKQYRFNRESSLIDSNETDTAGSYIDLASGKSGRGSIVFGDGLGYADFIFTTAGVVTLISSSNNVFTTIQTGTNHVVIKDNGTNVRIVNELGSTIVFNCDIKYTI